MPRTANPYYSADAAGLAPVGQGLTNLASVFAPPSAADRMTADQMGWQTKAMQDELLNASRKREGQMMLGDIVSGWEYGASDPRHLAATALQYGVPVQDLGDLYRVMAGNFAGATDETRMGALVGAGHMPGTDTSVSIGRQNELLGKKYGASQAELQMRLDAEGRRESEKPLTRDQIVAQRFLERGVEGGQEALGAMFYPPAGPQPKHPLWESDMRGRLGDIVIGELIAAAEGMGMTEGDIPRELHTLLTTEAMDLIEREGMAPQAAVASLLEKYNVRKDDTIWFNPFTSDSIQYDRPRAAPQQAPAPAQPTRQPAIPPGTIEDGFMFQGGDPADPRSWVPVGS